VVTTSAELEGAPAATYPIPPGSHRGEARLSMLGVSALRPGGLEDSTLRAIHVAFAVWNGSEEVWTVAPSEQRVELTTQATRTVIHATTVAIARPSPVAIP